MPTVPLNIRDARAIWGGAWVFFVDLSRWNPVNDYGALAASIDAAVIKITGVDSSSLALHRDSRAQTHVAELRARRVPLGAYHYAKLVSDDHRRAAPPAAEQARYFAAALAELGPFTLAVLDLEPGEIGAARKAGWSAADIEQWVRDFIAGLPFSGLSSSPIPAVYLSGETIRRAGGGLDFLRSAGIPLWWAGYPRPPFAWSASGPIAPLGFPDGWPDGWAWQYAGGDHDSTPVRDGGQAPGIPGDVDANIARRDGAFARALLGSGGPSKAVTIIGAALLFLLTFGLLKRFA